MISSLHRRLQRTLSEAAGGCQHDPDDPRSGDLLRARLAFVQGACKVRPFRQVEEPLDLVARWELVDNEALERDFQEGPLAWARTREEEVTRVALLLLLLYYLYKCCLSFCCSCTFFADAVVVVVVAGFDSTTNVDSAAGVAPAVVVLVVVLLLPPCFC